MMFKTKTGEVAFLWLVSLIIGLATFISPPMIALLERHILPGAKEVGIDPIHLIVLIVLALICIARLIVQPARKYL